LNNLNISLKALLATGSKIIDFFHQNIGKISSTSKVQMSNYPVIELWVLSNYVLEVMSSNPTAVALRKPKKIICIALRL
jgi:hypothetical protein